MSPSLLALSVLAASLANVFAEPSDNGYIGNNGHWSPNGIQLATLSTDHDGHGNNNHHGRANSGPEDQGNNVQQQQQGGNNEHQRNRGGAQNQNQNQNNQNSQTKQQQQQNNQNQNQNQSQNGQIQENTFSIGETQNNRGANDNNVNVNTANVNNYSSQTSFWSNGYCFSNSGHNSWRINTDAAFAVTSIGGSNDVADMRLFYWSTAGRGNKAVLRDAYYTRSGRGKRGSNQNQNMDSGHWKSGKLSKTVSRANLGSLAATSWTKAGKVGRTVFYVQGGYLRELTLDECDDRHGQGHGHGNSWDDEDRDGVKLHFNPGEMSAVSWFDDKGILHKRVYIRNTDTNQVIEYTWSNVTPYTTVNNLYATSFVETGAGSSAASLQVSRGKPSPYLWTGGPQGGAVKEDGHRHGKNAKAGTQLAAATAQGSGGASYVFFLNKDGRLTQSNRDGEGKWHENLLIKMLNGH
ncbi:hypothetical protein FRC05_007626 [Tulasnella sp. 425]|nr:hypothetical protein FRC05_007626 [Tulasnella sp. 425]